MSSTNSIQKSKLSMKQRNFILKLQKLTTEAINEDITFDQFRIRLNNLHNDIQNAFNNGYFNIENRGY